jgi:wyosine [tRNA(Phe)-imidazoG37] synthetase (radical SAM superfamily)
MSEDIDIKVVMHPPAAALKKGGSDRARLKALHAAVARLLEELGFPLVEQAENPQYGILIGTTWWTRATGQHLM